VLPSVALEPVAEPTPWPGANARLLGVGAGLPVQALDRLAAFSPNQFERFTLEWAHGYLAKKLKSVDQIQQRGGSGDKGRDIVVWLDPPSMKPRRWHLYQCKHYAAKLGTPDAATEIGKVIYNTFTKTYPAPDEYWFVTHQGVAGTLQDLLDEPEKMRQSVLDNWDKYCETKITSTEAILLTDELKIHIANFDFDIFRAKQPQELINEHA
jgi:hypothetical protein